MDTLLLDFADDLDSKIVRFAVPGDVATHIEPRTVHTPALGVIDQALVDAYRGNGPRRVIISMPPQEGKSQRCSRFFPTWLLQQDPDLRIAIVSYADSLARRWGRAVRNDLRDYPGLGLRVRADTAAANEWQLQGYEGGMITAGIESGLTGRPVDVLIIDDPLKGRQEADSETYRQMNIDWWRSVGSTRLSEDALVILVMTRWHEEDLAGWLTSAENEGRDDWRVINIPAQAEHDDARGVECKCAGDSCAGSDPLDRAPGEYMVSARGRTHEGWERRKRDAGPRDWIALFQGRPAPLDGAVLKRSWWQWYDVPRAIERNDGTWHAIGADQVLQSWDMAFKDTDASDYVVGTVWARRGPQMWLLDIFRERVDFAGSCDAVEAMTAKWPQARVKLIEDKANGPAVISQLRKRVGGMIAYSPTDSKLARAYSCQPFLEAGDISLPRASILPAAAGFVAECAAFPNGAHDDQVDSFTQAVIRMLIIGAGVDDFMADLIGQQGGHVEETAQRAAQWHHGGDDATERPAVAPAQMARGTPVRPPWLKT